MHKPVRYRPGSMVTMWDEASSRGHCQTVVDFAPINQIPASAPADIEAVPLVANVSLLKSRQNVDNIRVRGFILNGAIWVGCNKIARWFRDRWNGKIERRRELPERIKSQSVLTAPCAFASCRTSPADMAPISLPDCNVRSSKHAAQPSGMASRTRSTASARVVAAAHNWCDRSSVVTRTRCIAPTSISLFPAHMWCGDILGQPLVHSGGLPRDDASN